MPVKFARLCATSLGRFGKSGSHQALSACVSDTFSQKRGRTQKSLSDFESWSMVPPTGIEPVSSASYHFGFRRLIERSWSGLCLCPGPLRACRQEPSSLYTFPVARAWLGVATGVGPEGSPTLTPFSRRFRIRLPSERRHSFYPLNYGEQPQMLPARRPRLEPLSQP